MCNHVISRRYNIVNCTRDFLNDNDPFHKWRIMACEECGDFDICISLVGHGFNSKYTPQYRVWPIMITFTWIARNVDMCNKMRWG